MLDKKYLREHPEEAKQALAKRGPEFPALVDDFLRVDEQRRGLQVKLDQLRAARKAESKEIGSLMKAGQAEEVETKKAQVGSINQDIAKIEAEQKQLDQQERELLMAPPNFCHESVPEGGEDQAVVVKEWGEPRKFDFTPKDHLELCAELQLVNFEAGARLSGSGFPVMHGLGALLQRALIDFMLDCAIERGYTELRTPFMVHPRCAEGTGQLPKFGGEMYHVSVLGQPPPDDVAPGQPHFFLIPTAEVTICNYYRGQLLEAPRLPVKLCGYSPCWRVEAGSYGKEARGLTRVHQFDKVELVRVSDPQQSWDDLEQLTDEAEAILAELKLPYRRKVLPTGDMTFGSAKTYDVEVHCPAEDTWREVSSASNTTDYQARRMNLRFRRERGAKPEYPHLLNASALALPRLVIAVLENYQTAESCVAVPQCLKPYMGGLAEITPPDDAVPFV